MWGIPETPPLNNHALVIPPKQVFCEDLPYHEPHQKGPVFQDRHHLYWQRGNYRPRAYKALRLNPRFIIKLCRHFHDDLHTFQEPVPRPAVEIAKLAVFQAEIDYAIAEKYDSIDTKSLFLSNARVKNTRRNIAFDIERLSDEIDELKERKGIEFGEMGGVIPTQQYIITQDHKVLYEDLEPIY